MCVFDFFPGSLHSVAEASSVVARIRSAFGLFAERAECRRKYHNEPSLVFCWARLKIGWLVVGTVSAVPSNEPDSIRNGSLSVRRGQIQTGRKRNVCLSAALSSAALGVTKSYYIAWRGGPISTTVASMPWPTFSAARTRLGLCGEGLPPSTIIEPAK